VASGAIPHADPAAILHRALPIATAITRSDRPAACSAAISSLSSRVRWR